MNVSIDGYGNVLKSKEELENGNEPPKLLMNASKNIKLDEKGEESTEKKKLGIYSLDLFKNLKD
jgi:hypothetical protein